MEATARVLLILGSIVLSFVLGEIIVRVAGIAPDVVIISDGLHRLSANKLIGYEPIPPDEFTGPYPEPHEYPKEDLNALGFRDRHHQLKKPANVIRVAVLGDSITAGLWISKFEDTFSALLEKYLKQRGAAVEILNFAEVGYNTIQEVETFREKGLKYSPDMVVLAYCLNDLERDDGGLLGLLLHKEKNASKVSLVRLNRVLASSALYRFLRYRTLSHLGTDYRTEAEQNYERLAHDTTDEGLAALAEIAKDTGIKVLIVLFPDFTNLTGYPRLEQHHRVEKLCKKHNFAYLDLLPTMIDCAAAAGGPPSFDRYHPNEEGHKCAAARTADELLPIVNGIKGKQ
jgi:lysophospholipase L1-like esterase